MKFEIENGNENMLHMLTVIMTAMIAALLITVLAAQEHLSHSGISQPGL